MTLVLTFPPSHPCLSVYDATSRPAPDAWRRAIIACSALKIGPANRRVTLVPEAGLPGVTLDIVLPGTNFPIDNV